MAKYKVIALSVGGTNNRIFRSTNIVTDKDFIEGRAEQLVKEGFLEAVSEDEKIDRSVDNLKIVVETKEEITETEEETETILPENGDGIISMDEIDRKDIITQLKEKGIEFDVKESKKTLYDLWAKEVGNTVKK